MHPIDTSEIKGEIYSTTIPYDYLVYAVGAEVQTFNIPGVKEHACFMKELTDAERVRFSRIHFINSILTFAKLQREFMDCEKFQFNSDLSFLTFRLRRRDCCVPWTTFRRG